MDRSKYGEKYEKSKKSNAWAWVFILIIGAVIRLGLTFVSEKNDQQQYDDVNNEAIESYARSITASLTHSKWLEYDVAGPYQLTTTYAYTGTQKGRRMIYFTTPIGMCAVESSFSFELPEAKDIQRGFDIPCQLEFEDSTKETGKCDNIPDEVAFYLANNARDPKLTNIHFSYQKSQQVISLTGLNGIPYDYDHFKDGPDAEPVVEYTKEEKNAIAKNRTKARKELRESLQFLPGDVTNAKVKISSYTNSVTLETNKGAVSMGKLKITPDGYVFTSEHWLPKTSKDAAPTAKWKNLTYLDTEGKQKRGDLGIYFLRGVGESMLYLGEM